jgi:hypothetical protein
MIRITSLVLALLMLLSANTLKAETINRNADVAGVLIGPCGSPAAVGLTGNNDDFTNRSIGTSAVAGPDTVTTNSEAVVFKNTVLNTGAGDDAYIISVPVLPNGFQVEISTDQGERFVPLVPGSASVTVAVAYRAAVIIFVRVTAPAGLPSLKSFDTVVSATSTISPAVTNETIDRIYTGFIRLDHALVIANRTGVGGPAEAVPGAEVEFIVTYTNISTAEGGDCSLLTAYNIVINENGKIAPNNWGLTTKHIVGASDSRGGYIVGDRPDSQSLSDVVMRLDAGQSGVFRFKRIIR